MIFTTFVTFQCIHCQAPLKVLGPAAIHLIIFSAVPGDFVGHTEGSPSPLGEGVVPGDGGQGLRFLVAVDDDHDRKRHGPEL